MAEIIRPSHFSGGTSGGGPEDPMLEERVARLEDDMRDIKASLRSIELAMTEVAHLPKQADYAGLKSDIARLDGRVSQLPTAWQMFLAMVTTVVTTWSAGAAIVFTLLRIAKP